jgi:hypothetical protein
VVLNPTQFISRVAGAQDGTGAGDPVMLTAASGNTVEVNSDAPLRIGDLIQFDGTSFAGPNAALASWRMIQESIRELRHRGSDSGIYTCLADRSDCCGGPKLSSAS